MNQRSTFRLLLATSTSCLLAFACSSSEENSDDSQGGASGGEQSEATGGSSASDSGGSTATGGAATGGSEALGGASTGGMDTGTGGDEGTGGAAVGTGGDEGTGGDTGSGDFFRLDMNFYPSATCAGAPGYTMGGDFESGTCYTGAEAKQIVKDATPNLEQQAEGFLDQVLPDNGFFSFACSGTSPSFTRYTDAACENALGSTNADTCAFLLNVGNLTIHSQQTCSRP